MTHLDPDPLYTPGPSDPLPERRIPVMAWILGAALVGLALVLWWVVR